MAAIVAAKPLMAPQGANENETHLKEKYQAALTANPIEIERKEKYQAALKASLNDKIASVADVRQQEEMRERQAAAEYVQSDPLGVKDTGKRESMTGLPYAPVLSDNRKIVRFQNKKKVENNIFRDFGKDNDASPMQTVEIGGVTKLRVNFKRHWKSDSDLKRWQNSLNDNSRNDKLLTDVVERWHPNFKNDRADLTQKHNALFRQRGGDEVGGRHRSSVEKLRELQHKLAPRHSRRKKRDDFREAGIFANANKNKAKKTAEDEIMHFLNVMLFHCSNIEEAFDLIDGNGNGRISYSEFAEALKHLQYHNTGDIKFVWHKLDTEGNGFINKAEWRKLEPYVLQQRIQAAQQRRMTAENNDENIYLQAVNNKDDELETPNWAPPRRHAVASHPALDTSGTEDSWSRGTRTASLTHTGPSSSERSKESQDVGDSLASSQPQDFVCWASEARSSTKSACEPSTTSDDGTRRSMEQDALQATFDDRLPQMNTEIPRRLSIFVFRNADRSHAGEAVFIAKVPQKLKDLVRVISQACRPLIEPAAKLFDISLVPIRAIQQLQNGGTFLLKGQESLEPPPQFFSVQERGYGASMRHLQNVQLASSVEHGALRSCELPARPASSPESSQYLSYDKTSSSGLSPSIGRVGSPLQQVPSTGTYLGDTGISTEKWQVDDRLAMKLLSGGLGQFPRHHKFDAWAPLRSSSAPSIHSSAAVSPTASRGTNMGGKEPSVMLERPASRGLILTDAASPSID